MKNTLKILAVAAGLALSATAAQAAGGVKIGTLTCHVHGGAGFVLGSSRDVACTFVSAKGKKESYKGTVNTVGLDIGVPNEATLLWAVFAAGETKRGALAGSYVGAAADASVGVGVGAKVLVGGFNHSLTLQPLSVQAQTGLNLSVGVASLKLTSGK